jgi:hypothetical protein
MAWTKEELEQLEKAYKSGSVEVEYEGQKIRYRSLSEMELLLEQAKKSLYGDDAIWERKKINPTFRR